MNLETIIQGCKDNKRQAQSELYALFAPKMYAVCCKYSRNNTEAEDNLHDGFITILKKINQFKHQGSFEGWMKRIVINTTLEKYRKEKVFPLTHEEIKDEEDTEIEETSSNLEQLLASIQKLPNQYRLVFNLYVLDGYTHKEIAKMLKISMGTSKSNLSRAKTLLKKEISQSNVSNLNILNYGF